MKQLVIAVILLIHFSTFSQSVNDYEYVIIPEQYSFAKNVDQYQLNSLTQFLFNKYGFDSYRERDQKPPGLQIGNCNILYADVESESNFLTAKLKVVLKDCKDQIVFISEQGKSKEKDFKKAYHEALRKAFISIQDLKYSYNGKSQDDSQSKKETPQRETVVETPQVKEEKKETQNVGKVAVVEEIKEKQEVKEVKEITSILGSYQSADGFYRLVVEEDNITVFEGRSKIGTAIANDDKTYEVLTTQFSGNGKFKANTFIVDRTVKGVGVVQMIFSKTQ